MGYEAENPNSFTSVAFPNQFAKKSFQYRGQISKLKTPKAPRVKTCIEVSSTFNSLVSFDDCFSSTILKIDCTFQFRCQNQVDPYFRNVFYECGPEGSTAFDLQHDEVEETNKICCHAYAVLKNVLLKNFSHVSYSPIVSFLNIYIFIIYHNEEFPPEKYWRIKFPFCRLKYLHIFRIHRTR